MHDYYGAHQVSTNLLFAVLLEVQIEALNPTVIESAGEVIFVVSVNRPFPDDVEFTIIFSDMTAICEMYLHYSRHGLIPTHMH